MTDTDDAVRRSAAKPRRQPARPPVEHLGPGLLLQLLGKELCPIREAVALAHRAAPGFGVDRIAGRGTREQSFLIPGDPRHDRLRAAHSTERLGDHRRVIAVAVLQRDIVSGQSLERPVEWLVIGSRHRTTSIASTSVALSATRAKRPGRPAGPFVPAPSSRPEASAATRPAPL